MPKPNHYNLIYDGAKSTAIGPNTTYEDVFGASKPQQVNRAQASRISAYVFRGVKLRADALASMPWSITQGDTEIVTNEDAGSGEWSFLADLPRYLYLVETALSIVGCAYLHKGNTDTGRTVDLRYFAPYTMSPRWDLYGGLMYFYRSFGAQSMRIPTEDVIYFTEPAWDSETEPGQSPVGAALLDIGVSVNLSRFAQSYFERGAIRATMLQVEGAEPVGAAKQELTSKWRRFMTGIGNAFTAEYFSSRVTPTIVGDGVDALSNDGLTQEKRESILSALGVPHSKVLSNAANYATADVDMRSFYTDTIIPESTRIAGTFNKQFLNEYGLTLQFKPQEMSVFQADENERSASYLTYVQAGVDPAIAGEMLGLTLPNGYDYADLRPETPDAITVVSSTAESVPALPVRSASWEREAAQFRKWYGKRSNANVADFKADYLSEEDKADIAGYAVSVGASFPEWHEYP